jgi:hypothetical protein
MTVVCNELTLMTLAFTPHWKKPEPTRHIGKQAVIVSATGVLKSKKLHKNNTF